MSQKEYVGVGSMARLSEILLSFNAKNVLLVVAKTSYAISGAEKWVSQNLEKNFSLTFFRDFETNPKIEDIKRGIDIIKHSQPDAVVAIGGGSVIDVAKAINFLAFQEGAPEEYILRKMSATAQGRPFIAIPTTSGTGSEATHFAVVYMGKKKYSLAYPQILPDYALVDPELTMNMSPRLTASSAFDALSQAIEAYWSVHSTEESRTYSEKAIREAIKSFPALVPKPTLKQRIGMSQAAHLAGKAINIAQTTACHAISYPITSYFGISHGHAVALTLGSMLVYNSNIPKAELQDKRGGAFVDGILLNLFQLLGEEDALSAKNSMEKRMKEAGLETRLSELGIDEKGIETIIEHGFNPQRVKNNPRVVTEAALRKILTDLL